MTMRNEEAFSVAEAAKQLNVSRQYLYRLIADGRLNPRIRKVEEKYLTRGDIDSLRDRLGR